MMALTPLSAQSRRRLLCVGLCVLVVVTSTAAQPGTSAASGASSEVRPDGSTARRARAAAQPTPSPPSGHSGAAGGATNAAGVGATPTPAATPTPGAYVDIIYAKLNELFNSDSQLLTMEFPGRTLDEASFYYRVNDSNSQYLKPQTVVESEARLADLMVDPAEVVMGINGDKLSTKYLLALNSLVPKFTNSHFRQDQELMRKWLLSPMDVPAALLDWSAEFEAVNSAIARTVPADAAPMKMGDAGAAEVPMALMDFHQKLLLKYEAKRAAWEQSKQSGMENATMSTDPQAVDFYFRWLAMQGLEKQAEINGYWEDLVVRGYHHRVTEAFGFLDITTPGEQIASKKADIRMSEEASIFGGGSVFPVLMEPADWATDLSSSFTPKDLTMQPENIEDKINELSEDILQLSAQIAAIEGNTDGDIKSAQKKVAAARTAFQSAQTAILNSYSDAVVTAVNAYLDSKYGADASKASADQSPVSKDEAAELQKLNRGSPISEKDIQALVKAWQATAKAQQDLDEANVQLTAALEAEASAESSNHNTALTMLRSELNSKLQQRKMLTTKLRLAGAQASPKPKVADVPLLPTGQPVGPWTTVVLTMTKSQSTSSLFHSSFAHHSGWSLDLGIASGGGDSSSQGSKDKQKFSQENTDMAVGFQAMKVTIDRSNWFDPSFFAMTDAYYKVDTTDLGPPVGNGPPAMKGPTISDGKLPNKPDDITKMKGQILPMYATSFIVVRDVTIRYDHSSSITDAQKSYLHKQSSSGGGFLCFSYSTSSSSTKTSSSFFHYAEDNSVVIKIPGPQVLMWVQEPVPKDASTQYPDKSIDPLASFPVIPTPKPAPTPTPTPTPPPIALADFSVQRDAAEAGGVSCLAVQLKGATLDLQESLNPSACSNPSTRQHTFYVSAKVPWLGHHSLYFGTATGTWWSSELLADDDHTQVVMDFAVLSRSTTQGLQAQAASGKFDSYTFSLSQFCAAYKTAVNAWYDGGRGTYQPLSNNCQTFVAGFCQALGIQC